MYRDSSGTMPISLSSQLLWFLNQRVRQLGEDIDTHAYRMPVRKAGIFSRSLRSALFSVNIRQFFLLCQG
ncbi:MAG: hypothetical protein AABY96_04070, partial [Nitrospirota bacterium]